jgi:hypothetical protein
LIRETALSSLQIRNESPSAATTQLMASECGEKKCCGAATLAAVDDDAPSEVVFDLAKQDPMKFPMVKQEMD